jgi:hypothetical protein
VEHPAHAERRYQFVLRLHAHIDAVIVLDNR